MTTTKHRADCSRVFKNYDMTCDRCVELSNGLAARPGWTRTNRGATPQSLADRYCFSCPLWVSRCDRCGKPPYTD